MVRKILTLSVLAVVPLLAQAENTYPTLERVNYVLDCMDRHGGAKIEHLTSCSCEIDEIADKVTLDEFTDANIYIQNKDTPGDKGAVFHDTQLQPVMRALRQRRQALPRLPMHRPHRAKLLLHRRLLLSKGIAIAPVEVESRGASAPLSVSHALEIARDVFKSRQDPACTSSRVGLTP
jgi:hypothetical protein